MRTRWDRGGVMCDARVLVLVDVCACVLCGVCQYLGNEAGAGVRGPWPPQCSDGQRQARCAG